MANELENKKIWRQTMVTTIKKHWFYPDGELEQMDADEVEEIYSRLLDWLRA